MKISATIAFLLAFCSSANSQSDRPPDKTQRSVRSFAKIAGDPAWTILNINNFHSWSRRDAPGSLSPNGDNQGVYPRGTGNVIYTDGIYFGAKAFIDANHTTPAPRQMIRVGGKGYGYGLSAGRVVGSGATATAVPSTTADVRIYRIRRDYSFMSDEELRQDAANVNEIPTSSVTDAQFAAVRTQYDTDWKNWPVPYGAPYIERNGTPGYQPPPAFSFTFSPESLIAGNFDEPGIAGADRTLPADQVVWTVANDLNLNTSLAFQGSEPLGLELQFTTWGYKGYNRTGEMFFKRFKIINKGGVDTSGVSGPPRKVSFWLDSMFVGLWSDVDIGSFNDDLIGCDTTLQLGFAYNALFEDRTFRNYGLPPPSVGYAVLQGPVVDGLPGDSATKNFEMVYGKKNLPMTSFAYFSAGSAYSDPCSNSGALYNCQTAQWWRMLRGFAPVGNFFTPEVPYAHGPFPETKFPLSGDPVAQSGFLDGLNTDYSFVPGDRRFMVSSGPFTLAPGDTQEIVYGVVAGLSSDRLSSISSMKLNARVARKIQRSLLSVPRAPAEPRVQAVELDRQIILEWGSDNKRTKETEQTFIAREYRFEGYNIYQLPSEKASLAQAKKIATYDVKNGVKEIVDINTDPSGLPLPILVQSGQDAGVQRSISIKADFLKDQSGYERLNNGEQYYFAVTAYNFSAATDALPKSFESSPRIIAVKPRIAFGVRYTSKYGDTLRVTRTSGQGEGRIVPLVVNPAAGTGDSYEVRFDTAGGTASWSVTNTTKNALITSGQTNQSGDENYNILEGGILLKVLGPPPGMKDYSVPAGLRRITFTNGDGLAFEGFSGAIGWDDPNHFFNGVSKAVSADQLRSVLLVFAQASAKTTAPTTNGFDWYAGWDENSTTDANMSYAYRFLRRGDSSAARPEFAPYLLNAEHYGYQDYKKSVPLAAYNIDVNPPARLAVGFLESNVLKGLVDGKYYPPYSTSNTDTSGPREWLFVFNAPYTGSAPNAAFQKSILTNSLPVMWWCTFTRRSDNLWDEPSGINHFQINAYRVNTVGDVFSYTSPAPQTGPDVVKESAKRVGVFPNPYYGGRNQETMTWRHFVTSNNLPPKVKIYIFNLAGQMVRMLEKNDPSQFLEWDLTNKDNWQIASGIYVCYVEMPDIGETKVLKLAVIQPQIIEER